jgi:protein-disulfide isomerase
MSVAAALPSDKGFENMKPNNILVNATLAAIVAAATAAATTYLFLRYAPLAPDPADPERIERIIRDYLVNKPEILVEMTNELDKRQAAEQSVQQQKAISQNADAIFRSPVSHVAGNSNGDVSVVEFFDYNCPYCRHALPDVLKLMNEDGKVRLVLKELPILSDDSVAAAKLALAANRQGKYFEIYQKLFSEPAEADKDKALRIAKELGLDIDQLQKDAENPDIKKALDESKELAQKLDLKGTPMFLIGDRVIAGAPEDLFDQLKGKVAEVRQNGCASTC